LLPLFGAVHLIDRIVDDIDMEIEGGGGLGQTLGGALGEGRGGFMSMQTVLIALGPPPYGLLRPRLGRVTGLV
jgi:hypothetical protein